jgi:hypothetical protein
VGDTPIKNRTILPRSGSKHRAKHRRLTAVARTFYFFFTFDSGGSLAQSSSNDPNETSRKGVQR